jgi:hypothetical protein
MIELEHKNIVRYVTCWFEKRKEKEESGFGWDVDGYESSECNSSSSDISGIEFKPQTKTIEQTKSFKCYNTARDKQYTLYLYIQMEFCKGLSLSYYFEKEKYY